MSFSFSFNAKNRSQAVRILEKHSAPAIVKALIEHALLGVKFTDAVRVEASGHLPEASSDYPVSTYSNLTLKVEPILFGE